MRNRNYVLLTTGVVVDGFGSALAPIALAFAILQDGGSITQIGWAAAARALPALVLAPLAGTVADRWGRQHVMVGANVLSFTSQAFLAYVVSTGQLSTAVITSVSAINGIAFALYLPAAQGLLSSIVERDVMQRAVAVYRTSLNVALIVGGLSGGILVAAVGPATALAVDAGTFAGAALVRAGMQLTGPLRPAGQSILEDLRAGYSTMRESRWLPPLILESGVFNAVYVGGFNVLGPQVAEEHLGGSAAWGAVSACMVVGMVAGGLLMIRLEPARPLLLGCVALFGTTVPFVALAFAPPLLVLLLAAGAGGASMEVFGVAYATSIQQRVPAEHLSQIYAYDHVGSVVLTPVGAALLAPLATVAGTRTTLLGAAAVIVAMTAYVLTIPAVWQPATVATAEGGAR